MERRQLLAAAVATDMLDYRPGSNAVLTAFNNREPGQNFQRGETVRFQVVHSDTVPNSGDGHEPWLVTDGGPGDLDRKVNGKIRTTWYVNPDDSAGSRFTLTATGLSSGASAQTTFTDAGNIGTAHSTGPASSLDVSLTSPVSVGNTVIVAVAVDEASAAANSFVVSDGTANVYQLDADVPNAANGIRLLVFSSHAEYVLPANATLTISAAQEIGNWAAQVSVDANLVSIGRVNASSTATGESTMPKVPVFSTTEATGSYVVLGFYASLTDLTQVNFSPGNMWTLLGKDISSDDGMNAGIVGASYYPVVGATTISYLGQPNPIGDPYSGAAGAWAAAMIAYKKLPTLTLSSPTANAKFGPNVGFQFNGQIKGTAGGASQVRLTIKDTTVYENDLYYDGVNWVTTPTTVTLSLTTSSWTYTGLTAAKLTSGHTYSVTASASDSIGNQTAGITTSFLYDATAPSSAVTTPANNSIGKTLSLAGTASDSGGSALRQTTIYIKDTSTNRYWNGTTWALSGYVARTQPAWTVDVPSNMLVTGRQYLITASASDWSGNTSATQTVNFRYDGTAPTTAIALNPASAPGASGWYHDDVEVSFSATDTGPAGVDDILYSTDAGASWQLYSAPFTVSAEGTTQLRYYSTDLVGNSEAVKSQAISIDSIAPTVTNVFVRGSSWSGAYLSLLAANVGSSSATYGYAIPTGSGSAQLQTIPWRNINQISVAFSEDVSVTQAQLAIAGVVGSYSVSSFAYSAADRVATWTLSAPIGPDKLYLALPGGGSSPVTDLAGLALDGEWLNPASYLDAGPTDTFPSGNGVAGGDFAFRMDVLPGDSTGGSLGRVNVSDVAQTSSRSGQGVSALNYRSDFDGNNLINVGDVAFVKSKSGIHSLPSGEPILSTSSVLLSFSNQPLF